MGEKYQDIIHLPHKQSETRPHMAIADRAAQFAPFAALVGYDDAVREAARLTDARRELSDTAVENLQEKLDILRSRLSDEPEVEVVYFRDDDKKAGGEYRTVVGAVRKVDEYEQAFIFASGEIVWMEDIFSLRGAIFEEM